MKSCGKPRQHIKKQKYYFADKGPSSQSYDFPSSQVWLWELDYKESWAPKSWLFELWFWRILSRVPWSARRSNQSILGNQSWIFIGRTDAEAETPLLWPPDVKKTDSFGKTLMLERLKAGEEQDNRGWDGWMASLTRWTWVWASSGSLWWTGKPGMLRSMRL